MKPMHHTTRKQIARLVEAAGGLLWLAASAVFAIGPEDQEASIAILVLAAAGVACGLGLAVWQWGTLARGSRVAVAVATAGSAAMVGPWILVLAGLLATIVGTALVAIGRLRGPGRARTLGLPLLIGAIATIGVFPGTMPWIAGAFGAGHVAAAIIGAGPLARRAGPALAAGAAAALAAVVLSVALTTGSFALPTGTTQPARTGPLPHLAIIVDTDMLPDDWLALIYLASEPDIEIRAVTVASGAILGCEAGVGIARDLLAAVGKNGVPVACGPRPGPGGIPFPPEWLHDTLAAAASLGWTPDDGDPPGTLAVSGDAVDVLRTAINEGPVTIVSLGPPTNVRALLADPAWDRNNVTRLVQMAGAVDVPGNVEPLPSVEWNAAVDPAALAAVLASGLNVTLVSLDATNDVPVRTSTIDRWTADRSTSAAVLAARLLDTQRAFAAAGGYYTWDVLAAVAAREPHVAQTSRVSLRVSTGPGEAGRTIRDPAGSPVLVALHADASAFERIFLDALLGRAR